MSPISVGASSKRKQVAPKLWILLVGVNTYLDDELPSLRYSALDCQGLAEALQTATRHTDIHVATYHDFTQLPELKHVQHELTTIIKGASSTDTILFYFSGHGIIDTVTQQTYLCLRDTQKNNLENTAFAVHELLQLLTQSATRHQLVWLDACHSGGMTLHNTTPQLLRVLQTAASASKGFYAMLSCDTDQQSWEFPELGHGVFTYYLMRGLRGEAANNHGVVTADGLYRYVYYQTLQYIDKTNQQLRLINKQQRSKGDTHLYNEYPLQTPKRIVEGVGEIILAKDTIVETTRRVALVVEGLTNGTTLSLSQVLRSKAGFEIEYLSTHDSTPITNILGAIQNCLHPHDLKTTALLYLRGTLQNFTNESILTFSQNIYLSRDWLRQQLRYSTCLYLIIILDCPGTESHTLKTWVDDLQVNTEKGLCIIAGASADLEVFATALIQTLQNTDAETGLTAAGWITQLQALLTPLYIWLSGKQGVIEIIPVLQKPLIQNTDLGINPYLGLRAFSENDSQYFYGREALTQQLLNHIASHSFLAVVGASGSGKSSVVQAGLIAQLRRNNWLIYCIRPGANPINVLVTKLQDTVLEGLIYQGVEGFVYWLRTQQSMVVLVLDQFEELFTLAPTKERDNFLELILGALEYASDKFKLVITLRADFISQSLENPNLAVLLQNFSILVPPRLNDDEYRSVIQSPASKVGLQVEPSLVEVLLQELEHSAGDLPLLEFVLDELWHHRSEGKLTLSAYHQHLGGIAGALERKADKVYSSLDSQSQECAKWIFLSLTQLGEGTEDTRRRVLKSELVVKKFSQALVEKTLQVLTTAKLVVVNVEELLGASKGDIVDNIDINNIALLQPSVEVIHEILIRHWSTLRWWLEENRSRIRTYRQIEQAAKLWLQNDENSDFLLQGVRLAEAEDIYIKYTEELSADIQRFIEACLAERKRLQYQEKRRLRQAQRAVIGLSILGIAACSFGGLAYWQRNSAQISEIKALNESSKANLLSNQQLEALVASLKAAKQVKNTFVPSNIRVATTATLEQAISSVQERNRFEGHSDGVISVAFSPDGQTIASGSLDKTIKLWSRGGISKTLTGHTEPVYSIAFSPDGQILASGSVDKTVKLWNVQDGSLLKTLEGHTQTVNNVAFSPDGKSIATASSDRSIKIWSQEGRLIKTITGYNFPVLSVSFSPDGKNIAAGGEDKSIKIWDINDGRLLKTLSFHQNWVNSLSYSPDGKMLVSGGADKYIMLWNGSEGKLIKKIPGHTASVWGVRFSPNCKMIISASRDRTIKLWNLDGSELEEFKGHSKGVYNAVFSPDSKTIASTSLDGTVRLWQRRDISQLDVLSADSDGVYAVAYSPDGSKIVSASGNGKVKIWRSVGTLLKTFTAQNSSIYSVAFAPNGEFATAGSDGAVKIWQNDKLIKTIKATNTEINHISFSPDGRLIASASKDNTVKVYSVDSDQLLYILNHTAEVYGINFSPDGEIIASASVDKTIKLWRRSDGKLLRTLTGHHDWIYSATFSPDGKIIASTSADKTIKLWRRSDGKLLRTLSGHNAEVYKTSFSPDGQTIASGSEDKTIRLWHLDGHLITTLPEIGAPVMSVNFSPDGKTIVSGSMDNKVRVWRFDNQRMKTPELNTLIKNSCEWLEDYLKNSIDKQLCSS
ncbi:peptidase C14 caspase catalytic subunit p20 [Calothrix sp. NIES-4071]|nr:peptidase C14 caspase catalytic subunit p20 [Calothrix sp. NIES-4071]BAZ54870.1 peptidase C14 caspase catalytic subunit p20 [Calothrix sp. NIES-4105]